MLRKDCVTATLVQVCFINVGSVLWPDVCLIQLWSPGQIGDRGRAARIDLKRNIASESKPLTDMKIAKERLVRAMKSKNDLAEVYSI